VVADVGDAARVGVFVNRGTVGGIGVQVCTRDVGDGDNENFVFDGTGLSVRSGIGVAVCIGCVVWLHPVTCQNKIIINIAGQINKVFLILSSPLYRPLLEQIWHHDGKNPIMGQVDFPLL
jgi:hypothetical protein